ncbi:MAG: protein kinase [Acidobacteria bacterium]|nr:protein kinase [Acidobacteriota bacterium]
MELPARIGKYELQEFLGGGMSHVYRARDTVIDRTVAVKILTEAGCADEEVRVRFLAEARMAGNLVHDNILNIYDFGEDDLHRPYMVMEFLRGEDLRSAIKNGHTGDLSTKLSIALQIARALGYIHSRKIVHRDIKPENVHINTAGVVKLMDFGIAKTEGLNMTRAGYVLGTPFYMAPEQVMGQEITPQVDVYAFGILLFEIFTGVKPIQAATVERIFYFVLNEPINLEPLAQAGAPQSVVDLVARCTAKKPAERPAGFEPVIAELERVIAEREAATLVLPVPEPPPREVRPARHRRRRSRALPWIAALVLLAASGGIYFATRSGNAGPAAGARTGAPPAAPPKKVAVTADGMVLIPAGPFLFGKDKQSVNLPAYYIDRTEVSNGDYGKFCRAKGRPEPLGDPNVPVTEIAIQDARDYAAWAGKRLPTAQEWEKAARGTDGRMFPWGNQPDPEMAAVSPSRIQPVDAFENGASPYQVLQMIGNVWEFTEDPEKPSPEAAKALSPLMWPPPRPDEPWYAIRGQSFREPLQPDAIWDHMTVPARWKDANVGFRCARDAR